MNPIPELFNWFYDEIYFLAFREIQRLERLRHMKVMPTARLNFNRPVIRPMRSVNRNR